MAMRNLTGFVAGYDPGGNDGHGVAVAEFRQGSCIDLSVQTMAHVEAVIHHFESFGSLAAIGIDTLAGWGTGPSGWRGADLWLRRKYRPIQRSIVSPNGLFGSMGLNGMAVLHTVRSWAASLHITETHPKVLYWALTGKKYDYNRFSTQMNTDLSAWLGTVVETTTDHEWDAAVSILAAVRGFDGEWTHDLFTEHSATEGRLIFPAGPANYWWPE